MNTKKISTITFHASYNYGSCLQAYALQEYIKRITEKKYDYEIINLRTQTQKEMYRSFFEKSGFKNILKRIILFRERNKLAQRKIKYEDFIDNELNVTKEYNCIEELRKENWSSDYYLAGSDQLWNLRAKDFDWSYFLEFIKNGKKISYAASFGPKPQRWNEEQRERVKNNLLKFNAISVRENGSFNNVKELTGFEPEINVDPTMLLLKKEWDEIILNKRIIEGDYIFLYNMKGTEYTKIAYKISKELNIPVVISRVDDYLEIIYGFKRRLECGPLEFLNLIKNSKLVLSSSFHGTIFSILLHKPFFALKGSEDFRIKTLLEKMGLENRSIDFEDYKTKCKDAFNIDFSESEKLLEIERKKSEEYLKKALDIE